MIKTLAFTQAVQQLNLPGLHRNLFSSTDWLQAIYNTYQSKLFVKYIEEGGRVKSYILYTAVKNFLEWKICICSYCDYCDCYVESVEDWKLLIQSLRDEYPRYRIALRNLRDEKVRQHPDLKVLSHEKFHLLDLREDLDKVWRRTHDSFRAAVK